MLSSCCVVVMVTVTGGQQSGPVASTHAQGRFIYLFIYVVMLQVLNLWARPGQASNGHSQRR